MGEVRSRGWGSKGAEKMYSSIKTIEKRNLKPEGAVSNRLGWWTWLIQCSIMKTDFYHIYVLSIGMDNFYNLRH